WPRDTAAGPSSSTWREARAYAFRCLVSASIQRRAATDFLRVREHARSDWVGEHPVDHSPPHHVAAVKGKQMKHITTKASLALALMLMAAPSFAADQDEVACEGKA